MGASAAAFASHYTYDASSAGRNTDLESVSTKEIGMEPLQSYQM
jgi:hypothetical protein